MAWTEESSVTFSWTSEFGDDEGAFQRDAFQLDAFQVSISFTWSEPDDESNTWTEES